MLKIKFAQIDAKDDSYTRYNPIGAITIKEGTDYQGRPITFFVPADNLSVADRETMYKAEVEYLDRFRKLQEEIVEKYEPLLVGGDPATREEENEIYEKYKDQLKGNWDLYYT